MKVPELQKALAERGIRRYAVSIGGIDEDEFQYRLESNGKYCVTWITYYYERGKKEGVREFGSEDEACNYFLDWVLKDPTTRLEGTKMVPVKRI
jgi:hypothetical protein